MEKFHQVVESIQPKDSSVTLRCYVVTFGEIRGGELKSNSVLVTFACKLIGMI